MAGACTLLLGVGALLAALVAASAQEVQQGGTALPYEEMLASVREPVRTITQAVASLLAQLGLSLALVVASAVKFVVLLLHAIGGALGKETELVGPIRELETVFSIINASSPEAVRNILEVLVHKITELLKCILNTVQQLLGSLLHPHGGDPGHHSGLLGLVHTLL